MKLHLFKRNRFPGLSAPISRRPLPAWVLPAVLGSFTIQVFQRGFDLLHAAAPSGVVGRYLRELGNGTYAWGFIITGVVMVIALLSRKSFMMMVSFGLSTAIYFAYCVTIGQGVFQAGTGFRFIPTAAVLLSAIFFVVSLREFRWSVTQSIKRSLEQQDRQAQLLLPPHQVSEMELVPPQ